MGLVFIRPVLGFGMDMGSCWELCSEFLWFHWLEKRLLLFTGRSFIIPDNSALLGGDEIAEKIVTNGTGNDQI